MNISTLQTFLLWSTVVNYAILTIWFAAYVLAHDAFYRLHSRWFSMSAKKFDTMNHAGMTAYKIRIMLLLNLVPLGALWMTTRLGLQDKFNALKILLMSPSAPQ